MKESDEQITNRLRQQMIREERIKQWRRDPALAEYLDELEAEAAKKAPKKGAKD